MRALFSAHDSEVDTTAVSSRYTHQAAREDGARNAGCTDGGSIVIVAAAGPGTGCAPQYRAAICAPLYSPIKSRGIPPRRGRVGIVNVDTTCTTLVAERKGASKTEGIDSTSRASLARPSLALSSEAT